LRLNTYDAVDGWAIATATCKPFAYQTEIATHKADEHEDPLNVRRKGHGA